MSWQTLKIPNTQSATGILYVAVITTFLGELTAQLLSPRRRPILYDRGSDLPGVGSEKRLCCVLRTFIVHRAKRTLPLTDREHSKRALRRHGNSGLSIPPVNRISVCLMNVTFVCPECEQSETVELTPGEQVVCHVPSLPGAICRRPKGAIARR